MALWLRVGEDGSVTSEEDAPAALACRPGRYAIVPTAPDLLIAARLPSQGGSLPAGRVILAGDVEGLPFPNLINLLVLERKTGVLRVLCPDADRTLIFSGGELRGAASTHPGDRLGEIALRMGLVTPGALAEILAEPNAGRRLGRLLVDRGLLTVHELWRVIQEQVSSIFNAILLEETGAFLFSDEPVQAAATAPGLSAQGLLMDGLRQLDELGHFRKKIPAGALLRAARIPETTLSEVQRELLRRLAQRAATVRQLAEELRIPEFLVTKQLYHLAEAGLVQVSEPGAPQSISEVRPSIQNLRPLIHVFNQIFREIFAEAERCGVGEALAGAAAGALGEPESGTTLLQGISFSPDGTLDEDAVLARIETAAAELVVPPRDHLLEVLQEVMFFLLFTAGERLPPELDEQLNRRVKMLFGMLEE